MTKALEKAARAIEAAQHIVLAGHINPDGDTLGCVLALAHALRELGKDVLALSQDGVPEIYRWMPGADWIEQASDRRDFDLAIVCDAGAIHRVGYAITPVIESAPVLIDVDHHVADGTFGDFRLVDSHASATAELVWKLIGKLSRIYGKTLATRAVADCLMTGIITDTGSFRFMNVTPSTFLLAARLQRLGAVPSRIAELVFEDRSYASLKLLGRALDSLQLIANGRVAWAHVTTQDFEELDATDEDTEGIVNHVRAVHSAQVGILFREIPGRRVRVSLRARDGADVNRIASAFGGGGHRLAAGCSMDPPLALVESAILAEACRELQQPECGPAA
jgi:phosphoesterase RecJ-like protein